MQLSRSGDVLVHVGYDKTGTTWLQQNIFIRGVKPFFPLSARPAGASSLAWCFIASEEGYLLSPYAHNEDEIQRQYNRLIANPGEGYPVQVMSWERLSGNPQSSGFDAKTIAKRIERFFPNAKILIVIREQRSWLLSNYFEYLASGGTHGLKKFLYLTGDNGRPGFSPEHIRYDRLIEDYQRRFGEERVRTLTYEQFTADKSGFLLALATFIGHPIEYDTQSLERWTNRGRHHFTHYHFRHLGKLSRSTSLNNYSSLSNRYTRRLGSAITQLIARIVPSSLDDRTKAHLSAVIAEFCQGRYGRSNQRTAELTGLDLEGAGYDVS